jgi:hypothetical protein
MKNVFLALLLIGCFGVNGQDFKKLDEKSTDKKQMEFAKNFANTYFSKQISGSFYQFSQDEATEDMIRLLTAEKQKQVYAQVKSGFGEYKSLAYAQTWSDSNSKMVIYRFSGIFGDGNKLEIRVVLNQQGRIAGFFIKPWAENLQ